MLVGMDQFTRRLVGVGVHRGPVKSADLCRMFNAAVHDRSTPRHLSTDHDPLFEAHRWIATSDSGDRRNQDRASCAPVTPVRGTPDRDDAARISRPLLFWNARDLERKLADFQAYYNTARSHASLEGHTPLTFAGGHTVARAELNNVCWVSHCQDPVQLPVAA